MGDKYYFIFNEGSKIHQILCALMIIWPVFSYGTGVGWVSPSTLLLQSEKSPANRPLTDAEISWMASVSFITCIPSTLLFAYLADTIGRKRSLMFMSAMFVVCWLLKIYSADPWILVTARLVFGVAMGGAYVLCPPYLKEISEDSIRGALGSLVVVGQTGGNLVAYVLGDILEYQTLLYCCLALPAVHLLLFMAMPESPDYLLKKGRREDATKALAWLRCRDEQSPLVQNEVERITAELGRERRDSVLKAIARDDTLRTAFGIALAVTLARELCGANPVLTFAGSVFSLAGAGGEGFGANRQAVALGVVQLLGAIVASAAVEKAGRKSLLMISSLLSSAGMLVLAIWFGTPARITTSGWIPLTALCLCIFCDAAGLQPISVVLLNEIFSFRYRGSVSAVAMCIAAVIDFLQLLVFKPVCTQLGAQYPFIVFSAICLFIVVYVWRYVPETKARALDDIYKELQNRRAKVPRKNKEQDLAASRKLVAESLP